MDENIEKFIGKLQQSLADEQFVKLTLGNYKGVDEHLQRLFVRLIDTKKGTRLFFQYRYDTRDAVKNFDFDEGVDLIGKYLGSGFLSGHLFTTEHDFQLDIGKKNSRLNAGKPSFKTKPARSHDREKSYRVDQNAFYLKALGITTDSGEIRAEQRDKWKQINKFVEILAGLFEKSELTEKTDLKIVDMGSGKGYLTFAAYDHFANGRGLDVKMTGVDTKHEIVGLCNDVAKAGGFEGLAFVDGTIADFAPGEVDILIALHACDTATDDALYKGITANAKIIVAAPCCHKEVRRQMKSPEMLAGILKHGIMAERMAETITDGLRSILLERSGYSTKLFEFVSTQHTPKNNMIVAVRKRGSDRSKEQDQEISDLMELFGIREQRLATLVRTGAE